MTLYQTSPSCSIVHCMLALWCRAQFTIDSSRSGHFISSHLSALSQGFRPSVPRHRNDRKAHQSPFWLTHPAYLCSPR